MTSIKQHIFSLLFVLSTAISNAQEVIPFELGDDNRIYIKGCINQSDTLNLVFDLGANITVVNKTTMEANHVNLTFDTVVINGGSNGASKESKSFNNTVKIGTQTYTSLDVLGISYPEGEKLDGIIGWDFFADKIVEIDFETNELIISNELPSYSEKYSKLTVKFIDNLPYVKTILFKGKKKASVWAMLDTGYNSTLKVSSNTAIKHALSDQYQIIGESTSYGTDGSVAKSDHVLIPRIQIGGVELYNMPADIVKTNVDSNIPALLGGNLLKRFHLILDFKHKRVYLMPNLLINSEF